jgi:hypothetical protein
MSGIVLQNSFYKVYIFQFPINIFYKNKNSKVMFWRPRRCPKCQVVVLGATRAESDATAVHLWPSFSLVPGLLASGKGSGGPSLW